MFDDLPHLDAPQGFLTAPLTFICGRFDPHEQFLPITEADGVVRCHLSLIDALIETVQILRIGTPCYVAPTALLASSHFKHAHGTGYRADMHLGWPACNGKLLLRSTGRLATYSRTLVSNPAEEAPQPSALQVDAGSLAVFARLREFAGLFAWSETIAQQLRWPSRKQIEAAEHALDSVELRHGEASDVNQIAMFDPEFGQWHFVAMHLAESTDACR
ncbi:hypothetical protein SNK19_17055 [Ralstonia pseudosolanacearum]|uniref:hypothetical protein n=1 Tax=Ralstonia pseudosolanacearum TaxID=1310165 RepID=UPI003CEC67F7